MSREAVYRHILESGLPTKSASFLMQAREPGMRDVLVLCPTYTTVLTPKLFTLYVRLRLDFMDGLDSTCCQCSAMDCDSCHWSYCRPGFRKRTANFVHSHLVRTLTSILHANPAWEVTLNEHTTPGNNERSVVSDVTICGEWTNGGLRTIQLDVSHVDLLCKTHLGKGPDRAGRDEPFNAADPFDIQKPLENAHHRKMEHYSRNWNNIHGDDLIQPIILSSYGALYKPTVVFFREVARMSVNDVVDADGQPRRDYIVPERHILVSLLAQQFRARFAAVALRSVLACGMAYCLTSASRRKRGRYQFVAGGGDAGEDAGHDAG